MAQLAEELSMILIQMVDSRVDRKVYFFFVLLRPIAVLRCREVWFRRGGRIFRVVSAKTRLLWKKFA